MRISKSKCLCVFSALIISGWSINVWAAAVTWNTDLDGLWSDPTGWSSNPSLPGPSDDVTISRPSANPTVTHNGGVDSISSLSVGDILTLSGGTLTVANPSSVSGTLNLTGGILDGSASFSFSNAFNWMAGNLTGSGLATITPSGTLSLGGDVNLLRTLTNNGNIQWSSGSLLLNSGVVNNAGTINATAANRAIGDNGGTNSFNNTGTLNSNVGFNNFLNVQVPWTNTNAINSQSGTLYFTHDGTNSGPFNISAGAGLNMNNAIAYNAGTVFNGTGAITFATGTHTFAVPINFGTHDVLSAATLTGPGDLTFGGAFDTYGGILSGAGQATISSGAAMSINVDWTLSRTMTNNGTINHLTQNMLFTNGTLINNNVINASASNGTFLDNGGTNSATNNGTINVDVGSGFSFELRVPLTNSGTINVLSGQLFVTRPLINNTTFNVPADSLLIFNNNSTFNAGTIFQGTGTIEFNGGTQTFNAPLSLGARTIEVSSCTLQAASTLTFGGNLNLSNANLNGAGPYMFPAGFTADVLGQVILNSPMTNDGTLLDEDNLFMANSTITNHATITLAGPPNSGIFDNGGTNLITNSGTINSNGGSGNNLEIRIPMTNSGTINVNSGALSITRPLTNSATLNTTAGSLLSLNAANTYNAGTSFAGIGTVQFANGPHVFNTPINFGTRTVNVTNATLQPTGVLTFGGPVFVSNGTLAGTGSYNIPSGVTFDVLIQSFLAANLTNGGDIELADTLFPSGTTLTNNSVINMILPSGGFLENGGVNLLNNVGTINADPGNGDNIEIRMPFTHSGMLNVLSGGLSITRALTDTGTMSVASGTSLAIRGDSSFNSGATFTGTGAINITAGTQTFNTPIDFGPRAMTMLNSTVTGPSNVTIEGPLSVANVTLSGAGQFITSSPGGKMTIAGDGFISRNITANGPTQWNAGNWFFTNAAFNNAGTFTAATGNSRAFQENGGTNSFSNTGTFNRNGAGAVEIRLAMTNSGLVDVISGDLNLTRGFTQSAGTTRLTGGNILGNSALAFNGGVLTGGGNMVGTVTSSANVQPGLTVGSINITGTYAQSAGGKLSIDLGGLGTNQYDHLTATGAATLNGNLTITLVNGFVPPVNSSYIFLTAASVSGTFSSLTLPPLTGRLRWHVVYHPTTVEARVILPGDANCDGVMTLADVAPFAQMLVDPASYLLANPSCDVDRGDMNNDGNTDGLDIQIFTNVLLAGG